MGQQYNKATEVVEENVPTQEVTAQHQNHDEEQYIDASQLPEEVFEQVLLFLDIKTLLNMRQSCKRFADKIRNEKVGETKKQLNPRHDNQNELYYSTELKLSDLSNVIGFHFSVESHDQGWSSVGGSFTWGEIGFIDDSAEKNEITNRVRIFVGKPATIDYLTYNKFVHRNEITGFEKLTSMSKVGIWACSCYACWICHMGGARIRVVYLNSE